MEKTSEQPNMETIVIKLPEEIYSESGEIYEGENYHLTIKGKTAYLWAITAPIPANVDFGLMIQNIRGILPVACCATDWEQIRNEPIFASNTIIELKSVERERDMVRVIIRKSLYTDLRLAVGVIFAI